jgi:hypothetical protein
MMCFFSNRAVPRRPKQSLSSYCPLDTATFPPDYIAVKKYPLVIQTHGFDSQGFVIDGDPFSGMVEFSLTSGRNAGNNDDHSGMQRFLSVKSKKIGTVVGYKRVVLCADGGHELPIFRTTKLEIIDVICQMTHRVRHFDQGGVQVFIDQELPVTPQERGDAGLHESVFVLPKGGKLDALAAGRLGT